jgi:nucleotide-binding universal stress UspA family protein
MATQTPTDRKTPKLVVGFDASDSALHALDQAVRFCASWPGTEVIVVQSTHGPVRPLPGEDVETTQGKALRQLMTTVEQRFRRLEDRGEAIRSARAIAHLSTDDPVEAIANVAYQEGADLILVGRSDKGSLERLVLGSVAEGVLRKAPCSVLICSDRKDRNEPQIEPPRPQANASSLGRRHTYHHQSRNAEANAMMPLVFPMP